MQTILLTHVAATWFMVGLIWLVQIVHYPLFANVGQAEFETYSNKHQMLITFIVGPVMVAELVTAILLVMYSPTPEIAIWFRIGLGLVVVIWISTVLIQVPQHSRLAASGFDLATIKDLVGWNWIRTVAWTARGAIMWIVVSELLPLSKQ